VRRLERPACPACLVERGAEWTGQVSGDFYWPSHEGVRLNHVLLPTLRAMTDGHCSYCDSFPLDAGSLETIDHFRPKSLFPEEKFHWSNLYLCCPHCQLQKGDRWHPALLRPDDPDYAFARWFRYLEHTGELEPHPSLGPQEQERVRITIDRLGLNGGGLPVARRRVLRQFRSMSSPVRREELLQLAFVYLLLGEI
jgi:uncharacterized protein (TIGR02646 family)